MAHLMDDRLMRAAIKARLVARYREDPETLVLEELGLKHGAARVDIVVVNGMIHGFELKSDRDTLLRLPDQVRIFSAVLDRATLVVGCRHFDKATRIVPDWWGLKLAEMRPRGAIHFSDIRRPSNNPSPEAIAIAKLLWRDEAVALLDEIATADGVRSKPRVAIYSRLAEVADLELLRSRVRRQLRHRKNWRSAERRTSGGG